MYNVTLQKVSFVCLFLSNFCVQSSEDKCCYDFDTIVTLQSGSTCNFGTGIIRSNGGINSYTNNVKLFENEILTLQAGDGETKGVFRNHGRFEIYKGSKITGDGKIINYTGFKDDTDNNRLIPIAKEDDGYKIEGYNAQNDLDTEATLKKATYFDLVNDEDTRTKNIKIYTGSEFYTTSKTVSEKPNQSDFVRLTDSYRGTNDEGEVEQSVSIEDQTDTLDQTKEPVTTAYDLGSARDYCDGYEAIHKSDIQDDIRASFFSIPGYQTESSEGATAFKFGTNLEKDVYVPKVDEKVILGKTMPDSDVATSYEQDIMETLNKDVNDDPNIFAYKDWSSSDPVTTYHGDNSWFNGVYKLKRGGIIVKNAAGMFGGRVELGDADGYTGQSGSGAQALHEDLGKEDETAQEFIKTVKPTEFEWEGGVKDEYNKPNIYMNGNSTLYFNLQPDADGNEIFSFYGNLFGTERDRLIFEQGEVRIKGDCSGFKGKVAVTQGAKFEVRSSDETSSSQYSGKFPHANIYQIYGTEAGADAGKFVTTPGSVTEINTATMENVTINNGNINLKNDTNDNDGAISLKSVNIERASMTTMDDESTIENTFIRGVLVANENMTVKNTTLQGGVLALQNGATLNTNTLEAGSTIASWGNGNYKDVVRIGTGEELLGAGVIKITDGHTLKFFGDYNINEQTADKINASTALANIQTGGGIEVGGMNFNSNPTANEYIFNIFDGSGNNVSMPISVGGTYAGYSDKVFDVYVGGAFNARNGADERDGIRSLADSDVKYEYNVTNGVTKVPVTIENGKVYLNFSNGNIYETFGQTVGSKGNVVLRKAVSNASVESDVAQDVAITQSITGISDVLTDSGNLFDISYNEDDAMLSNKKTPGKYHIWNKTFGEHSSIDLKDYDNMKMNQIGTMLGFDSEAVRLQNYTTKLMPTMFAGLQHSCLKHKNNKSDVNGYFGGVKLALFSSKHAFETYGIYEYLKGNSTIAASGTMPSYKIKVDSYVINLGVKYQYNLSLATNLFLRPNLLVNYLFVTTPAFTGYNDAEHKLNNRNLFDVVPGISINRRLDTIMMAGFVSFHKKFGTKSKTTTSGVTVKTDYTKKHFLEYGAEIKKTNIYNTSMIGLRISRKTLGIKGFKAMISAGIKF